jgi:heme-degrading monooxygenase HmoA
VYVYVWEYQVHATAAAEFIRHYGADGTWVALFRQADGYLGTELLRDRDAPNRFMTIDRWRDEAAFASFRGQFAEPFEALDRRCAALTAMETPRGHFHVVD